MILPLLAVTLAQLAPSSTATPAAQPPTPPAPPAAALSDPSPPGALGRRIAAVRAQTTVAPILVLVEDTSAFNAALAGWHTEKGRVLYPILYDHKTPESRENIARFVRAFKPTRIVRFSPALPAAPSELDPAAPLYATFGAKDEASYLAELAKRKDAPGPLGAVVTQRDATRASAALALAAAYGQVLIFAEPPAQPGQPLTFAAADQLSSAITSKLKSLNIGYLGMGDQIDALTLCYDNATNVVANKNDAPTAPFPELTCKPWESLSFTDIVGRSTNNNRQDRWAYASHLTGSLAPSTYRAMCAIFLQPTSAAAFNGYGRSSEFGKYDPAQGLKALKGAGLTTSVIDQPNQSAEDWRQWASGSFASPGRFMPSAGPMPAGGALTADLFFVNTMGNHDFFQLQPGLCYAGDAPFLSTPAAVSFIHSWSLQFSGKPTSVGGRWLDRGAFCYIGSVHEPLLSAFVPPSQLADRLIRGWPIAAAARVQASDRPANPFSLPWRIAVLGDALWTLGPALKRTTELPTLKDATDLDAERAPALKDRRWADAFDVFTMLGRDADAARLARAAIDDEPEKIDHAAALRIVSIAYRAGDTQTLVKAAQKLGPAGGGEPNYAVTDAIWHALWPKLNAITAQQAEVLSRNVRPYSYTWDTVMATTALKRAASEQVARGFFDQQVAKAPDPKAKQDIESQRSSIFR